MSVSRSFLLAMQAGNLPWKRPFWWCCMLRRQRWLYLFAYLLISSVLLISCSWLNFSGDVRVTPTPTPSEATLARLHWCGKPLMIFRDEGAPVMVTAVTSTPTATVGTATTASTPTTITDWTQVEPYLGFTVYLPPTLPLASCLTSASGTIHDPILGGSFTIGYLLPDHSSVSLSEAPLRSENTSFQCILSPIATSSPSGSTKEGSPTTTPGIGEASMQVCTGAHDMTRIVFSARGTTQALERFFASLQPDVKWIPSS
jgi:hypothetical protein